MELYLLRHGLAAEKSDRRYPDDRDRPLTQQGQKRTLSVARRFKALKWSFDLILTSPLLRARQTAEITASVLGCKSRLRVSTHLAPGGDQRKLVQELNTARPRLRRPLLVGHEPYLSELIAILLTGKSQLSVQLKKGGVCKLEAESLQFGRCAELHLLASTKFML